MRTPFLASTALLALAAAPLAGADWIRVEPAIGAPKLLGHVAFDDYGTAGTRVETSDLDLDGRKAMPMVEIDLSPPLLPIGFNVGAYSFRSTGEAALGVPLDFGGATFTGTVSTEIALQDLYGEVNFQPVRFGLGGASVGLALHQLKARTEVATSGLSVAASKTVYFPAVAARAYVSPIDALQVEAAVQLFKFNVDGTRTAYVDAKAQVAYFPIDYLGFFAGYRYLTYDLTVKPSKGATFDAMLALSGPYLGAEARF